MRNTEVSCPTCGVDLGKKTDTHDPWRADKPIFHCEGSTCAFGRKPLGVHHSTHGYPPCWKCGKAMGCRKCTASFEDELLCENCIVWCTQAALLQHGPITNDTTQLEKRHGRQAPQLGDYPTEWKYAYARSERDFSAELSREAQTFSEPQRAATRRMMDTFSDPNPLRYAEGIMGNWFEQPAPPSKPAPRPLAEILSGEPEKPRQTKADMEKRRELLHEQFLWIKRREQAVRLGEPFTEEKPQ